MANLLRCLTCGKILTSEEVLSHNSCNVEIKKWKNILASDIFTMKNDVGEKCALIYGLDGICYRVTKKKPDLIPITYPTEHPTIFDKNKNRHRLDRTIKQHLY